MSESKVPFALNGSNPKRRSKSSPSYQVSYDREASVMAVCLDPKGNPIEQTAASDLPYGVELNPDALHNDERARLSQLLRDYSDIFTTTPNNPGHTTIVRHRIDTGDHPPIHQAPYRKG